MEKTDTVTPTTVSAPEIADPEAEQQAKVASPAREEEKKSSKPKDRREKKWQPKKNDDSDNTPENSNRSAEQRKRKQKVDNRKGKKGDGNSDKKESKKEKKPRGVPVTKLDFTNFKTHEAAADAVVTALGYLDKVYPSAIKEIVVNCFKRNLKSGLKIRQEILEKELKEIPESEQNVLTQCIFKIENFESTEEASPGVSDYILYYTFLMIQALVKADGNVLNKSTQYLPIYHEIIQSAFNLDSDAKLAEYTDIEQYQFNWLYNEIADECNTLELIKIYVHMKQDVSYKPSLISRIQDLLKSDKKGDLQTSVYLINQYLLHSDFDIVQLCESLIGQNIIDEVVHLIGKKSVFPAETRDEYRTKLVAGLLKKNATANMKICETICTKCGFEIDQFPQLVENKKRGSVRYFVSAYLKKKPTDPQYRSLNRIEDLFTGLNEYLVFLCEFLMAEGKQQEAKGIYVRNKLKVGDFNKTLLGAKQKIGKEIDQIQYDKTQDYQLAKDMFEPVSQPYKEYVSLPRDIDVQFIDTEEKINLMAKLQGQAFIGVDSEWRPQVTRWHKPEGVAIFQIAGYGESFIIDMIALRGSKKLNDMLSSIFSDPATTVIGFGFKADLSQFSKHCPDMTFINNIANFLEMQDYYKALFPDHKSTGGFGLAAVCNNSLQLKLCKGEQMSNWEQRPLRHSQEHYAALDAWILTVIIEELIKVPQKGKNKVQLKDFVEQIGQANAKNPRLEGKNKSASSKAGRKITEKRRGDEDQVSDINKIKEYKIEIEYHKERIAHFENLVKQAEALEEDKKDEKVEEDDKKEE